MTAPSLTAEDVAALGRRYRHLMHPPASQRFGSLGIASIILASFIFGAWWLGFTPQRLLGGMGKLAAFVPLMVPPDPLGHTALLLDALGQTLAIALLGTLGASLLAIPFAFLAARNVVPNIVVHHAARRLLDVVRSIDILIWALIWIAVVGLGPFAGVLAIATSDCGSLGKLFSETVEAAGSRAREGVRAAGGGNIDEVRFGLVPAVMPVIAAQILYFYESNIRSATVIGIVGAGGIGLHLYEAVRTLEWREVSFLTLMIMVTVAIVDAISSRLRSAMRGR